MKTTQNTLQYMTGFGNEFETEALSGALPTGQFSPQKCTYKLYAEQISSTAFTAPRAKNRRTWTYRMRPSVVTGGDFVAIDKGLIRTSPGTDLNCPPNVLRWSSLPLDRSTGDFVDGLTTIAVSGDARAQIGLGIHVYRADRGMGKKVFYCADGEMLIVPQQGAILAHTELGRLHVVPGEILVIPRGLKFRIELPDGPVRGYVCENYGAPLELPERGPVGANGFANDRDFQYPVAWFEENDEEHTLVVKFCGELYQTTLDHSPFDVVAWVGNSAPYKYDLARYNVINTVSFDHPDPSIFTVLTSPSDTLGVANLDFVVFPPRWMVAENTFRPPWFHRNIMSEFMGLIRGTYDAKGKGFEPGGMSLHNCMTPHGPEATVFEKASNTELKPERYENTLAFMFESRYVITPTRFAMESECRQRDYSKCWTGIKKNFDGNP
ncbi:homogentisate 1,2-dioxygenase [Pseudohongiella spirulinae]|uniref:Homogentisate 1,2-dioxygenase n=1 Tax=Pseudohongiella spirulinae TaxID=1249552 RepID=A0A0S2KGE6_9GAMM|nr:homogentisate 1,2-dioxygenase [Pseudohongiella spirulinae]ALO47398.1 Homogentisate 1,2-dioxygenase [Pseudohongiella spirulinae]